MGERKADGETTSVDHGATTRLDGGMDDTTALTSRTTRVVEPPV